MKVSHELVVEHLVWEEGLEIGRIWPGNSTAQERSVAWAEIVLVDWQQKGWEEEALRFEGEAFVRHWSRGFCSPEI